jgi:hypothetical protein
MTLSQPEGSRKKGRPKRRYPDSVLKDLKIPKVTACCRKTQDKDMWGKTIKEAKAHTEL